MTNEEINAKIEKMVIEPIYTVFPFVSIKIVYTDFMCECELTVRWYARGEIHGYTQIVCPGIMDDENYFKKWSMVVTKEILSKITESIFKRGEK